MICVTFASIRVLWIYPCIYYTFWDIALNWFRVFLSVVNDIADFLTDIDMERDGSFIESAVCYGFFAKELLRLLGVILLLFWRKLVDTGD